MKTSILSLALCLSAMTAIGQTQTTQGVEVQHLGNNKSLLRYEAKAKYILLPIEEQAPEAQIELIANGKQELNLVNMRLAITKVDYYMPLELTGSKGGHIAVRSLADSAVFWKNIKLSDTFEYAKDEQYRPVYHFTPPYGWMNDPNGMFYHEGKYHLFYQYNPYASVWGNMHWGHATSSDLVRWEHQPVAIAPDVNGAIFSGSAVVDKDNTAGFGKNAIVAFYTYANDRQTQGIAYSTDGGKSFTKYLGNPVLTSDQPDFRDPKVIWHEGTKTWVMILAVGQEMQFYTSHNLKEWTYASSFGKEYGAHGGVWECPDLMELEVEGTKEKRWMLIVNINPGGPFGGSAAQYFVGDFDGKTFKAETAPSVTKWMDHGKDHYATVSWSNMPKNRKTVIAWMSNWQYANQVPSKQFRSSNSIPRELALHRASDGSHSLSTYPSPEVETLRSNTKSFGNLSLSSKAKSIKLPKGVNAYELNLDADARGTEVVSISLSNPQGEVTRIELRPNDKTIAVDRTKSGVTSFSKDFPATTVAPAEGNQYKLRIFVDKSSIEVFDARGRYVLTNLVFPTSPYNTISFESRGGKAKVNNINLHTIK